MNLHIAPGPLPYLNITLTISAVTPGDPVHLARWRPGRYEAANYTKFIRNVQCHTDTGESVALLKDNFYTWHPQISVATSLVFTYQYYADQLDAGSTYADENICYLNFHNFVLFLPGKLEETVNVFIDLPDDFEIATALPGTNSHQWKADNFYHLADSPLLASNALYSLSYTVDATPFTLWFHNLDPRDHPTLVNDFEAFTRQQIRDVGTFPADQYHFLIITYPQKLYHGVEHGSSTVICLGPSDHVLEKGYDDLLGISSHELFHAWNIIKIRPREFQPYDFSSIVSIDTGFVAEGFTTYLGDLFLTRSGARDRNWYCKELSKLLQRHWDNHGRLESSLIDSSRDLWADGYQLAAPDRKGSIYVEGAIFAMLLDLEIRLATTHQSSLLKVVAEMYARFSSEGYTAREIREISERVAGRDLGLLFDTYLYGRSDTKNILRNKLSEFGLKIDAQPDEDPLINAYGIRVRETQGTWMVIQIHPNGPAAGKLRRGDVLSLVNGTDVSQPIPNTDEITVVIQRKGVQKSYVLHASPDSLYPRIVVSIDRENEALNDWWNLA